jgi:hypothetical protein
MLNRSRLQKVVLWLIAGVMAAATIAPAFADQPPGQLGYEGQPGNQGDGLLGYEGQPGNQGG